MIESSLIILFDKNKKILLQHRDKNAERHPNIWGFFGGKIEENESPLEAVKRECMEELNYELENPRLVLTKTSDERKRYCFIEEYNPKKKLTLKEGDAMQWFKMEDVKKIKTIPLVMEVCEEIASKLR